MGRRLSGSPRLALAAAVASALLIGAAGGLWLAGGPSEAPRKAAAESRGARSVAALSAPAAPAASMVPAGDTLRGHGVGADQAAPERPAHDAAAARAAPTGAQRPPGARPVMLAALDDAARREAREAVAAARAARRDAAATGAIARPSAPAPASSAPGALLANTPGASAPGAQGVPVWAVSTRLMRTRFESEQMLVALRAAAARSAPEDAALRFEVVPVGSDWRAVSWPFVERGAAERLRDELHSRGLRVEVLAF